MLRFQANGFPDPETGAVDGLDYLGRIFSGLTLIISLAASPSLGEENMNSTAESILQSMSCFMSTIKALRVSADVDFEIINPRGQKLQFSSFVTALIERPANLHLTRKGMVSDYDIIFNGKIFTVYSRTLNAYSQIEGTGTIDEAFWAHEYTTGLPVSGGDFLFSAPEDVKKLDVIPSEKFCGIISRGGG